MILAGSLKHPTHEAPCTYMPFRHSPRNCVGMRFSLLEIMVTLVRLPRKYKLERTKETAASYAACQWLDGTAIHTPPPSLTDRAVITNRVAPGS